MSFCVVIESMMTRATKQYDGIDAYLARVPATHRVALKKLRSQIRKLYPKTTEHISYGMPLFKLHGHPLAGFRAAKHHSGLFLWSSTALGTLGDAEWKGLHAKNAA